MQTLTQGPTFYQNSPLLRTGGRDGTVGKNPGTPLVSCQIGVKYVVKVSRVGLALKTVGLKFNVNQSKIDSIPKGSVSAYDGTILVHAKPAPITRSLNHLTTNECTK